MIKQTFTSEPDLCKVDPGQSCDWIPPIKQTFEKQPHLCRIDLGRSADDIASTMVDAYLLEHERHKNGEEVPEDRLMYFDDRWGSDKAYPAYVEKTPATKYRGPWDKVVRLSWPARRVNYFWRSHFKPYQIRKGVEVSQAFSGIRWILRSREWERLPRIPKLDRSIDVMPGPVQLTILYRLLLDELAGGFTTSPTPFTLAEIQEMVLKHGLITWLFRDLPFFEARLAEYLGHRTRKVYQCPDTGIKYKLTKRKGYPGQYLLHDRRP